MKRSNVWGHFRTVTEHRWLVMVNCFRVGLFRQGLLHDLSKYSPEEFAVGVRYYQGNRSPNAAEREAKGFSAAWLHHKGRNKHHFEYWIDFSLDKKKGLVGHPMPVRYVAEMVMDRIAACRVYRGKDYTDSSPLEYYEREKPYVRRLMHPDTARLLERLLVMLSREGEAKTFRYMRRILRRGVCP